ncbi:General secretion pathway protein H [Candidatus Nitrotoga sp. BS]|uniref:GspH/FimT family pseudopilin n=1 Tax=Candidatus Nitrotoga sp. BS TaxID=2890408 RepID=UPI001EF27447|nr:GspH/FimT family protein [Candidatus Nitrotoga sp. BS]CAH1191094.1 General secretion pathway protein H [Candidatus Nitrotoga sp. BS]
MGRIKSRVSAGFTLLELLVVLMLMVMVYAMAVPMISAGLPGTELKGAARQLAAGLRQARSLAVTRKVESTLTLDVEKRNFKVSGDQRRYVLPAKLDISLFTAQSEMLPDRVGAIRFYPDGSSTGGRITVTSGVRKYEINVDWLTGQVNVLN